MISMSFTEFVSLEAASARRRHSSGGNVFVTLLVFVDILSPVIFEAETKVSAEVAEEYDPRLCLRVT